MRRLSALVIVLFIVAGCDETQLLPERPTNVPESAVWGGGVDGGSWLVCKLRKERSAYACEIYWDSDGTLWAKGTYLLRKVNWDEGQKRSIYIEAEGAPEIVFNYFDGQIIHLKGKFVLVPHGIIDSPFGDGHGKKQQYDLGEPVGPESEY